MALLVDDTVSRKILVYGRYKKEYLECLEKEFLETLPSDNICLDLGANLGNRSLVFSRYFREVHAFEPNGKIFKLLSYNSDLASNIIAHNIGASNKNAIYPAEETLGNQGANSIVLKEEPKVHYLEYDCRIIDDYLPQEILADICFIKIDVEGHELQELNGLTRILRESSPFIAFELLKGAIKSGKSPVINFLKVNGYKEFLELYKVNPVRIGVRKVEKLVKKNYKMLIARK